jgi:membrane carboxypeptidase/penicillin-binding protein
VDFTRPAGVVVVKVDSKTGKLPYPDDPNVIDEVFLEKTEPTDISEVPEPDGGAPQDAGAFPDVYLPPLPEDRR